MKSLLNPDAVSPTGINIGSSGPLETLLSTDIIKEHNIDTWYFNLETYIRNFIDCMEGNVAKKSRYFLTYNLDPIINGIADEIELFLSKLPENIDFVFYTIEYTRARKIWNNFRTVKSFKGFRKFLFKNMNQLVRRIKHKIPNGYFMEYSNHIRASDNVVITTSIPIDLIPFTPYRHVFLIDSFTGKIKDKYQWYTKYHPLGKLDLSIIPFIEPFVFMMGDKWLVEPVDIKLRKRLYTVAKRGKWTQTTRKSTCYMHLRTYDKDLYDFIKSKKLLYTT